MRNADSGQVILFAHNKSTEQAVCSRKNLERNAMWSGLMSTVQLQLLKISSTPDHRDRIMLIK